ncbi:unnamed protein product [Owenia fusiformis]|uniref:Uncharacterized protein n=1 Tax=Owenia fusiformis TaxID=6347 RepID=A0A8J1UUM4_OWEFU|nr:unnamed protein product [Owenia fusiformis]
MLAVGFTTGADNGHTFIGPFTVKDGNNRDLFFKIYYTKDKRNSLSWYNAKAYCEGENGYLAKLDSSQANDGIKKALDEQIISLPNLSASKGFWIGLIQDRNVRQSSSYYWIDEFNFQSLECTRSTQLSCRREATAGGENTNEESCRKNMCCWTGTECVFPKGTPNIRQDNSCEVEDRFRDACKGNNGNPTTCRADKDCCYRRPNDNQYPTCFYKHSLPGPLGYTDWGIGKGGTDSNDRRCGILWQDFSWQWDHQKCQSNNGNNVGFICQYPVMPSTISPSTTMEQTTAATTITTQSTTTTSTTIETTQSPMTTTIATTIPIQIVDTTLSDTTTIDTTVAETTIVDTTMVDTTLAETTIVDTTMADTTFADTTIVDTTIDESTEEPSTTPLVISYSTTRHSVSTSQEFELTTAREIAGTTTTDRSSAVPPSTTVSIAPSSSVLTSSSTASSTATVASTTSLPSSSTAAAESSTSATQMSSTIDLASIKREREESDRAGKIEKQANAIDFLFESICYN